MTIQVTEELLIELGFEKETYAWILRGKTECGLDVSIAHSDLEGMTLKQLFDWVIGDYQTRLYEEQWGEDW